MSCVLHIGGKNLDVDRFIEESGIVSYRKWHKGEPKSELKPKGKLMEDSGCSVDVSKAGFDEFQEQLKDAELYLELNRESLMHIRTSSVIDYATLDFGVNYNINKFNQNYHFSSKLLTQLTEFGIDLELSVYGRDE